MNKEELLKIRDLSVRFPSGPNWVHAVNGVNLSLGKNEILGVVGESGCGKSISMFSILRLLPDYAKIEGSIEFEGRDLLAMSMSELRKIRGKEISMIFQEPMTSLNPVFTVEEQLTETLVLHEKISRKEAVKRALDLLDSVEIPDAKKRMKCYPHQLSGGLRQRIMIAMALSCNPRILLADEPTTALDVTIQAQILELMLRLKKESAMSIIMVTHDLGVIAEFAERVAVMYFGRVVEEAPVEELFRNPRHPYTCGLLECIPALNIHQDRLSTIEGFIPSPLDPPRGCAFYDRCTKRQDCCREKRPESREFLPGHWVACHLIDN